MLAGKGREVEIPAFRNGMARAGFHGLCGKPLGAADYLALADAALRALGCNELRRVHHRRVAQLRAVPPAEQPEGQLGAGVLQFLDDCIRELVEEWLIQNQSNYCTETASPPYQITFKFGAWK